MDTAIRVAGLSKQYQIGAGPSPTFREHLSRLATSPLRLFRRGRSAPARQNFWALKDVSFEVQQGEVLGIVGRNGAGKSTLLKVLSRITEPTSGTIDLIGRIASLLEVGTGFHGELTGRENVFLNGAILGMSRQEVRRKFDEIVAFAEVEEFIDTAVKHYSSGMYLRLAFAVAAHLETEILIVDEVLAVGDAAFQKKCLGKMEETSHQGRTILFVSHNLAAVNQLCTRAVWLSRGHVNAIGPAFAVVAQYLSAGAQAGTERQWTYPGDAPGDGKARLIGARVRQTGDVVTVVDINRDTTIEMDLLLLTSTSNISASFFLCDVQGTILFASSDWRPNRLTPGLYRFAATIPAQTIGEGRMTVLLQAYYYEPFNECFHLPDQLAFEAVDSDHPNAVRGPFRGHWPGAVRLRLRWDDPQRLDSTSAATRATAADGVATR